MVPSTTYTQPDAGGSRRRIPHPRNWISRAVALAGTVLLVLLAPATALNAQEETDSLQAEVAQLRARMDSLEALVQSLRAAGAEPEEAQEAEDALTRIREAAARAASAAGGSSARPDTASRSQAAAGRQRSLQALNPEISVTADLFGHMDLDDPDSQNFVAREFEVALQSALDPFSRAKVFIGFHNPGPELVPFEDGGHGHAHEEEGDAHGGEMAIGVEEGYVEWVGLPGGFNVKLGRFYQRFGTLNRWHAHALPFQSRSLPHLAFIGEEPLGQSGAGLSWLLPWGGLGALEATVELTASSNERLFGESNRPSVLGNVNGFWQLSEATDLDLSLSWVNGSYESEEAFFDRNLYGAEAAFTWRPPAQARYRGVVFRGGAMVLDGLVPHEEEDHPEEEDHGDEVDRALGLWSLAEMRLNTQWLVGARLDWSEDPVDPHRTAWLVSPTLTWWQSEYVRIRLEYDLVGRSWMDEGEGRLWLQVTAAMGPHKHETY